MRLPGLAPTKTKEVIHDRQPSDEALVARARDVPPTVVGRVVDALEDLFGFEGVWVTDASRVRDFGLGAGHAVVLARRLGIEVGADDLVVDVAERLDQ